MTDEQIIKAVDVCKTGACRGCPYHVLGTAGCISILMKDVFGLINRQKAEVERLKAEIVIRDKIIDERGKEVFRHDNTIRSLHKQLDNLKSEAIKEFAEELEYFVLNEDIEVVEPKCKDYESYINGANQFRHQIKNGINNRVKEMTEVETNQRKER